MRFKTILALTAAAVLLVVPVAPAAAADAVGITTTVDSQLVSISASHSTINYGTLGDNSSGYSPFITLTNDGTTDVQLMAVILGVDGPGAATWAVRYDGQAPGTDECSMRLTDTTSGQSAWLRDSQYVWWPSMPTIGVGGTRQFDLELRTGVTSAYGTFTIPVVILASAS